MSQIRSHQLAKAAFERVQARSKPQFEACQKAYGALAHKLPVLILQHGLAQATGFLLAKGKDEHIALLNDLAQVLGVPSSGNGDGEALHQRIIEADAAKTMLLTRQALDASGWLKRYVQGVLKVDATGESSFESAAGAE
ncbi:type III-B CRISPR module-associated protein Cmr5 [Rheinheimera sediminis]|uniref:type III-B CRISPR module-associated protein Cmr5 n=1 Tax=Rheinheimera sp. YQF-1 TaxID=2499626 RepID=UPI000FDAD949|nr:type III-B CRISPR module-associated protein Cmr5 [Rheinheimera sp. YQF-1]RVT47827.1 type III-B CRISPR module-associated protein Cmr5 [Rheinheimera sp. YQF-1]